MKPIVEIINQISVLESRSNASEDSVRSFIRIKGALAEMGYSYYFPLNEEYKETRTDVEATITGENNGKLVITKVIKPVIVQDSKIIQRAVVIVEAK